MIGSSAGPPAALLGTAMLLLPDAPARYRLRRLFAVRPSRPGRGGPERWLAPVAAGCVGLAITVYWATPEGVAVGVVAAVVMALLFRRALRSAWRRRTPPVDPLREAAGWDVLAACLRAGLSVPAAVRIAAGELVGQPAITLRRVAELLAVGADPVDAWEPALADTSVAELARAARRTARSGAALARAATTLAENLRTTAEQRGEARCQRVEVLISGPLGLCFLPAFLFLGVVPVVMGLASTLINLR